MDSTLGGARVKIVGGPGFDAFSVIWLLSGIIGIIELIAAIPLSPGHKRHQVKYILLASIIAYASGSVYFLSILGLKVPPIDNLILVIYGALMAYAIVKQRLMSIRVVISRGMARLIAYAFYIIIYLALSLFYFSFVRKEIDLPFVIISAAYGILVAESFQSARLSIQTTSDKLFLKGKYDYYIELDNISRKLVYCIDIGDLLNILQDAFLNTMEIKNPRLFLLASTLKNPSEDFMSFNLRTKEASAEKIAADTPLKSYFSAAGENLAKWEKNPPLIQGVFTDLSAELIIPCLFRRKLMGMIVLGGKLTEEDFTDQDLRLLNHIGSQTGAALERIHAYEDLKAEIAKARSQLEISSRLSSLGTLAAGITHEIRNPLAVIQSKLELMPQKLEDKEYLKSLVEIVPKHIDRIVELINRMFSFARPEKRMKDKQKIAQIIKDTIDLIDGEANRRSVKLDPRLDDKLFVHGDYNQLSQVFLNLMLNGIQSMPEGGTLKIETLKSDDKVEIKISDTGVGIAQENLDKVFDPFFTTRPAGVGLGLSISRTIVEEHGGTITIESELGKGATFIVSLPAFLPPSGRTGARSA